MRGLEPGSDLVRLLGLTVVKVKRVRGSSFDPPISGSHRCCMKRRFLVREGLGRMKNDKADAKVTTNRDESWHSLAAHDVILIAFG